MCQTFWWLNELAIESGTDIVEFVTLKHVFLEFDKGTFAIVDLTKYLAENFHGK